MTWLLRVIEVSFIVLFSYCNILAQEETKWFDRVFPSVALLERITKVEGDTIKETQPHGTGFFVWNYKAGPPILVTNKHVFQGQNVLFIRFRVRESDETQFTLMQLRDEKGKPKWVGHPDPKIDVAAMSMEIRGKGTLIALAYSLFLERSAFRETEDVIYFGFPLA